VSEVVVCSFHSADDYYRRHGDELRRSLAALGVDHVVREVQVPSGRDWADVCRMKVPFLAEVCRDFPDRRVIWIDADCRLTELPDFVSSSTADVIGFQRGFAPALSIGYGSRTRFWEPCFWGVAPTEQARAMVRLAAETEARSTLKATDDYFFEEAWRTLADDLTFQVIPSSCAIGRGGTGERQPFFVFGASGNVDEFKNRVVQHQGGSSTRLRHRLVRSSKRVLARLPDPLARDVLRTADRIGLTGRLVAPANPGATRQRRAVVNATLRAGFDGDVDTLERTAARLVDLGAPTPGETATVAAARSFAVYAASPSTTTVPLAWWARPFPGNFGDWLSPLVVADVGDARVTYVSPTAATSQPHLVAVGSIGRFVKPSSVVVGTGLSSTEHHLDPDADYVSLRGPLTAQHLQSCGGPVVDSFGDPAIILSRLLPVDRRRRNGRRVLVRHLQHARLPVRVPDGMDELRLGLSHPDLIAAFVSRLAEYDQVVTSALHVLIACQSYGIPCALVSFEGFERAVHGTGIKYRDYALGAGVEVVEPTPVPLDLRDAALADLVRDERVSEQAKDAVEDALREALARLEKARGTGA
jgi:hypothetical protein